MKKKFKNTILKTITTIMAGCFILGACGLESSNRTIPLIMCAVSIAWISLFLYANPNMELKGE